MSQTGNVVDLTRIIAPKKVVGGKRNVAWVYGYNPEHKCWQYSVTVTLRPQVFEGCTDTEAEARAKCDNMTRNCVV